MSTDAGVREASTAASTALAAFEVQASMRTDVAAAVAAFAATPDASALTGEVSRFVSRTLRDHRRRGLHLPAEDQEKIRALRTKISDLCIEFQTDLGAVTTELTFSRAQLAGLPDDWLAAHAAPAPATDAYVVRVNAYPDVVPVLKSCSVPQTRGAVEAAFNSRCVPSNVARLEEIVALRHEAAVLLGYPTHAAFVLEEKMAGNVETVNAFLGKLLGDMAPLAKADLQALQQAKMDAEGADSGPVGLADYRFYIEAALKEKYAVDHDKIKSYFPLPTVLKGMLQIYEGLFGLRFSRVEGPDVDAHVWHPDVSLYSVDDADTQERLGWVYLDMHPRANKYNHAAVFPLLSGREAGELVPDAPPATAPRVPAVAAMVCNFTSPTADTPSLLLHSEAVTLLHEFGHVMHHICSRTRTLKFSSFRCEGDFVEAPSQALESWCFHAPSLQRLSGHYATNEPLPAEMATALNASRNAFVGLLTQRQVFLAQFDMELHAGGGRVDSVALLDDLHTRVLGMPRTPGTNLAASFGHVAGGYDAGYFGYSWSEVLSSDIYSQFEGGQEGSPTVGRRYRDRILAPGGSVDAADFLKLFLGRAPNNAAFLRHKGLKAEGTA